MAWFDSFERTVALRYLRSRRQEGFISVIAWFSLGGIALGVATLIIVMAVMNGFRAELLGRILGLNGHLTVYGQGVPLADWEGRPRASAPCPTSSMRQPSSKARSWRRPTMWRVAPSCAASPPPTWRGAR
jgi:ABC-type lipoprotein release transport system permease subunit